MVLLEYLHRSALLQSILGWAGTQQAGIARDIFYDAILVVARGICFS
jgi:hypothetical protein